MIEEKETEEEKTVRKKLDAIKIINNEIDRAEKCISALSIADGLEFEKITIVTKPGHDGKIHLELDVPEVLIQELAPTIIRFYEKRKLQLIEDAKELMK